MIKYRVFARCMFVIMYCVCCFEQSLEAQIINTVAGNGMSGYNGDGIPATSSKINNVPRIAVDWCGNVYLGDAVNNRIRKVDVITGVITTVAGTGVAGYNGDGIPATNAQLDMPTCLAFDVFGNLFFADGNNNRVRKIDKMTGIITTYVGTGTFGFSGDGGPASAATIKLGDIACDKFGNLYMCDHRRIRKIDPSGIISTIAGTGLPGVTTLGVPATSTNIHPFPAIACDNIGDIYTVDSPGVILKISASSGIVTKVAGSGIAITPYGGDGLLATACNMNPSSIYIDDTGSIFIAAYTNNRCIKIDTFGYTHTVAGTGISGFGGDGGPATLAKLWYPKNVQIDRFGQMFIADWANNRIRKVTYTYTPLTPTISISGVSAAAVGSTVTVSAVISGGGSSSVIRWMNNNSHFATTTAPYVTYSKTAINDTITARLVTTEFAGCNDSATSNALVVGVESVALPLVSYVDFSVYPNPVHSTLSISGDEVINSVTVTNLVGEVLINENPDKEAIQINIAHLPPGMYLLRVNAMYVQRFMKE